MDKRSHVHYAYIMIGVLAAHGSMLSMGAVFRTFTKGITGMYRSLHGSIDRSLDRYLDWTEKTRKTRLKIGLGCAIGSVGCCIEGLSSMQKPTPTSGINSNFFLAGTFGLYCCAASTLFPVMGTCLFTAPIAGVFLQTCRERKAYEELCERARNHSRKS